MTPGRARWGRWAGLVVVVGVGVLGAHAAPAAADPPAPSDFRSTVTGIEPGVDGVRAEVVGGDAFLELTVEDGHEVVVAGYGDEPYLRFLPDGTVERNARSEATFLNEDRRGAVEVPPEADNDADPEWEEVAGGGTYAWHDHRIHWMGSDAPQGLEPGDVVQAWTVDITADGTPAAVQGELVLAEDVSPLPWFALALLVAAAVAVAGRRRAGVVAPVAVVAAAIAAVVAGAGELAAAPSGSGASPFVVLVPAVGGAAVVAGVILRDRPPAGGVCTLAGAACVIGWAVLRAEVLWTPVLPTELPADARPRPHRAGPGPGGRRRRAGRVERRPGGAPTRRRRHRWRGRSSVTTGAGSGDRSMATTDRPVTPIPETPNKRLRRQA